MQLVHEARQAAETTVKKAQPGNELDNGEDNAQEHKRASVASTLVAEVRMSRAVQRLMSPGIAATTDAVIA